MPLFMCGDLELLFDVVILLEFECVYVIDGFYKLKLRTLIFILVNNEDVMNE